MVRNGQGRAVVEVVGAAEAEVEGGAMRAAVVGVGEAAVAGEALLKALLKGVGLASVEVVAHRPPRHWAVHRPRRTWRTWSTSGYGSALAGCGMRVPYRTTSLFLPWYSTTGTPKITSRRI